MSSDGRGNGFLVVEFEANRRVQGIVEGRIGRASLMANRPMLDVISFIAMICDCECVLCVHIGESEGLGNKCIFHSAVVALSVYEKVLTRPKVRAAGRTNRAQTLSINMSILVCSRLAYRICVLM